MTKSEKTKAIKKVERAIDKMVDLQDMGFGCGTIEEILSRLQHLEFIINEFKGD